MYEKVFLTALWLSLGLLSATLYGGELSRTSISVKPPVTMVVGAQGVEKLINKLITLDVKFESDDQLNADIELLSFDAHMPDHRHGMIVKPSVTKVSRNLYIVEGVKFHMRGAWEMQLKIRAQGVEQTMKIPLSVR